MAALVADGAFDRAGVHPPEALGAAPGMLDTVIRELQARGVRCRSRVEALAEADREEELLQQR